MSAASGRRGADRHIRSRRNVARRLDARAPDFTSAFEALISAPRGPAADVAEGVREIIAEVRARGDAALIEFTSRFDGARLAADNLRVSEDEIAQAEKSCPADQLAALDLAAVRIEAYHRRQLPRDDMFTDEAGVQLGWRWTPLDSVGLYAPGGTASYPSSVLMNAIPAQIAGVKRIAMATPASGSQINPLVLAAAKRAGVSEIYRIGGAQAIAALAYGTSTVPRVDKIVGPGNAWVAAAKREVFGNVGIDSIAGPSEILVVADSNNHPEWIAADLLSQAEHDVSSQSILITDSPEFAERVEFAVQRALSELPRHDIAGASWRDHGAIIVVETLENAAPLIDRIAPEHLEIAIGNPESLFGRARHAGAIFLGPYTPEAMGDYIAGPNHVLPTAGTARFSSGLSVLDFLKRTTILSCSEAAIRRLGPQAVTLARAEGLEAHARSLAARLNGRI
jgi:histidinol dehydrogenase